MMCFTTFQYKFNYADKELWANILNHGFKDVEGCVVLQINDTDTVTRSIIFGNNNNLIDFITKYQSLWTCTQSKFGQITVTFDTIWDQTLFWNCLPIIDPWLSESIVEPDNDVDKCNIAISKISEYATQNPRLEMLINDNIDIPFEYIKWIILQVHKINAVKSLYLSPDSKQLHIMFVAGTRWLITPTNITNAIVGNFDYDDGFSSNKVIHTAEMLNDYNKWKLDKTKPLFKLC